jgi:glutamate formiminotransferase
VHPNFSEGRRPEVIESLRKAIASVPGILVLDVHSDADHNRSVVTFAGPAAAVVEAAFQAIKLAAERINLDEQRGQHPRVGATDVVPFVPLAGARLEDCVALARLLGRRVGDELQIPVYLYEAAATRLDRVNLEDIRKGEYEGLRRSIEKDPERLPDFGPRRLGPAGATVIGARQPLIAFNIYLTTPDVAIAKKIARAVRHSSGGLRYVKALGLEVGGRAQVSMNLTDHTQTPLARVVELVRQEAARQGVAIHHSELVGLLPQQAMIDAAAWYLQLER